MIAALQLLNITGIGLTVRESAAHWLIDSTLVNPMHFKQAVC